MNNWMYRCNQYFEFDGTPEETKVRIVSLHLEGKVLQWHQNYIKGRSGQGNLLWAEYVQELSVRFGEDLHYNPMA